MKGTQKVNVKEIRQALKDRINELKGEIVGLTNSMTIKESTKSTRRHALRRDLRIVTLLAEVTKTISAEEMMLTEEALMGFNQLCYPAVAGSRVVVQEGDSILLLMEEYSEVKDLLSKLNKAADKTGCRLDFATGKVVKK